MPPASLSVARRVEITGSGRAGEIAQRQQETIVMTQNIKAVEKIETLEENSISIVKPDEFNLNKFKGTSKNSSCR